MKAISVLFVGGCLRQPDGLGLNALANTLSEDSKIYNMVEAGTTQTRIFDNWAKKDFRFLSFPIDYDIAAVDLSEWVLVWHADCLPSLNVLQQVMTAVHAGGWRGAILPAQPCGFAQERIELSAEQLCGQQEKQWAGQPLQDALAGIENAIGGVWPQRLCLLLRREDVLHKVQQFIDEKPVFAACPLLWLADWDPEDSVCVVGEGVYSLVPPPAAVPAGVWAAYAQRTGRAICYWENVNKQDKEAAAVQSRAIKAALQAEAQKILFFVTDATLPLTVSERATILNSLTTGQNGSNKPHRYNEYLRYNEMDTDNVDLILRKLSRTLHPEQSSSLGFYRASKALALGAAARLLPRGSGIYARLQRKATAIRFKKSD